MTELWTFENEIYDSGVEILCGVDEAGRGPLAGPVCAAAVILPRGLEIEGLNDSKKLSEQKRDKLFDLICSEAVSFGIAFASVEEIEEIKESEEAPESEPAPAPQTTRTYSAAPGSAALAADRDFDDGSFFEEK